MRLYLASYRVGDHSDRLRELLPAKPRVAIIANALDILSAHDRSSYCAQVYDAYAELSSLGFFVSELDLREYFSNTAGLAERLDGVDLVWLLGGETFVLRRAMALSGFDAEVVRRLGIDELAFGGFSAGSVVATPSLDGIHLMDDSETVPEGYPTEIIWDGLGLVDFAIVPHWRSALPEAPAADKMIEYFEQKNTPYERLMDGDVILRNGDRLDVLRSS